MDQKKFLKILKITALGSVIGLAGLACLTAFLIVNAFFLRHERAAAQWKQREPYHYIYNVHLHSIFFGSNFQIEILNNKVVRTIDLDTGEPAKMTTMAPGSYLHQTSLLRDYIIIDQIFTLIAQSQIRPRSLPSFLNRMNPTAYAGLVDRGLLPKGREGCDPAFPKVIYNAEYGYPERLDLYGSHCSLIFEQKSPIYITIDTFQVLP